ncbi:RsmD family RNA methyltransferase [Plasmodium fragile]|uniref:RsmD family RNA methyltransferase n=1 Tax=Plasmodium fragile TaxID=5857 RepID=A0A0D9QKK8_PLAFR|nr:RsmD family RNA methyltransferase [Plasmodium fragile]KJP86256.1 RsmD family RNA methyltransferase [Plasmodium fragile]
MKALHLHQLLLPLLLLLWLSLSVEGIRKSADTRHKKGLIKRATRKVAGYTRLYKRSFKLKEEEVLGRYEVKAYFFFDESFEKRFKWNLYYKFCRTGSPNICNYIQLRRQFEKWYGDKSFSIKKYMSDVTLVFNQFSSKYSILQFDVKLEPHSILKISKVPNLSDILMESLTNLISRKKLKPPSDIPSWRLSFNYITGVKKLVMKTPAQVPGMNFYFYFVIPAYKYYYSRLFANIGDIHFKYEWGIRNYKVGYFTMEHMTIRHACTVQRGHAVGVGAVEEVHSQRDEKPAGVSTKAGDAGNVAEVPTQKKKKQKREIKKDEYGIPDERLNITRHINSKIKSKYNFCRVKTYNETININYKKKKILSIHEGKLKNRRIYSPDTYTRPMMSKVKESLFSILSHLGIFSNSSINVLDVFSGSGNLGIECISRDIPHVTFVDLSLNSCKTIYENLKLCNINHSYNQIIRADAMELLKCPLRFHIGDKYQLAFFTPPYEQIVYSELIRNIANSELFDRDCLVFIEYPKELEMLPQRVYNMIGLRNRKFGRTYFALYVLNSSGKYLFAESSDEFYPLHYNRKQRRQAKYL